MKDQILNKLREIEVERNVEILFAVESGSRAWGFESPDSDYDIRFVYKRERDHYLSLWQSKDTIQFMTEDDLDGSGWDLKKASVLLAKSNASFLGWLFSPIIYMNNGNTLEKMKKLAQENFNPVSGFYHFHSMNKGFYEQLESGDIGIKAFFYATRTALCANWILHKGSVPPVYFRDLYELIDTENANRLDQLIEQKSKTGESEKVNLDNRVVQLVKNIVEENEAKRDTLETKKPSYKAFDEFFINALS